MFSNDGAKFRIRFNGGAVERIAQSDGIFYLRYIIQRAGKPIHAVALYALKMSANAPHLVGSSEAIQEFAADNANQGISEKTTKEDLLEEINCLRKGKADLRSQLKEAKESGNLQPIAKLEQDLKDVSKRLANLAYISPENADVKAMADKVKKAIDRAYKALPKECRKHLKDSVKPDSRCWKYSPAEPREWLT